ncbi:MAG: hypothetical protein O7D86_11185 [Proteobacteria bacterium]|nr:hypothetical protein [Pseudomonadota bacterium]
MTFAGVVLIQISSLAYSADINPQAPEIINRTLGHKPIFHSKWPKIKSAGIQQLDIDNSVINLKSNKKNNIVTITVEENLNKNTNNMAYISLAHDRDIKYEIDKLILDDLIENAEIITNTLNSPNKSQVNTYNAVVNFDTYNLIIKSIIKIRGIESAQGIVKINDVIHLVPNGIDTENTGISSVRHEQ